MVVAAEVGMVEGERINCLVEVGLAIVGVRAKLDFVNSREICVLRCRL